MPRHSTIGATWLGHMDKLPKSKAASVCWEVPWLMVNLFNLFCVSYFKGDCALLSPGSTSDWGCCCTDQGREAKAVFDSHIEDACKVVGETLLIRSNNECERGTVSCF